MTNKLILVTGATGYIASRLIPRLLESGRPVRALVRHPLRLKGRSWFRQVEVVSGDVMIPSTLASALAGVETAYYLIHNMASGHGYTERELEGARNFVIAAETAGIQHIIYLGGLADIEQQIGSHMRSRIQTGAVLRQGRVPVTEFRAGVVAGSGSISFEMIRFMTELLPVIVGTTWMNNKSQPIAVKNVIDYLMAALVNPNGRGHVFEVGGPEIAAYKDLMLRYAQIRGLKRRMFLLPYIPIGFMAFGVGLMTPVPRRIATALIGGLSTDSVVKYDEALRVFPEVKLIGFDEAVRTALEYSSPAHIERVWDDGTPQAKSIKHEGCFIDHREIKASASVENVFRAILQMVNQSGWQVEVNEPNQRILVRDDNQINGDQWFEWRLDKIGNLTCLTQTIYLSPRGTKGFLYWVLLHPLHVLAFRNLLREVVRGALA